MEGRADQIVEAAAGRRSLSERDRLHLLCYLHSHPAAVDYVWWEFSRGQTERLEELLHHAFEDR